MNMKYITNNVALSCLAVALPLLVVASDDPDVLPADSNILETELESVSESVSSTIDSTAVDSTSTLTEKTPELQSLEESVVAEDVAADPVSVPAPSVAAATSSGGSAAAEENPTLLSSFVDAMRPVSGTPPLDNDRFTFYLSDEVLFAQFERSAARYDFERARVHLGFMFTEDRDTVFQGGLAFDASFVSSFRLSFGTRLYGILLGEENNDAFAAGIGGELAYQLPFESLPLELSTSLYYAPDVLTFGQGDRVIDWQLDVAIPFRSQLSIFTGIRFLQVDTRPGDTEIDNRLHVGIRWDFI